MLDPAVKIVKVSDQASLDPATLLPSSSKIVTYTVGAHGPFNLALHSQDYNTETVERKINENVATLRAIGALPAA